MEGAGGPWAGGGGGGVALTGARAWLFLADDTPMGPSMAMASLKRKFDTATSPTTAARAHLPAFPTRKRPRSVC